MKLKASAFRKSYVVLAHDLVMAAASFALSLFLRLGQDLFAFISPERLLQWMGVFTLVCLAAFWSQGMYRSIWRYASLRDLVQITRAVTLSILGVLLVMFLWNRGEVLPRSALIINWFVLMFLLGGPRLLYRLIKDGFIGLFIDDGQRRVPVMLIGAGDGADLFIRETRRGRLPYSVVGLLSFKQGRIGRDIQNVRVLGSVDEITDVVDRLRRRGLAPERIILTRTNVNSEKLREVFEACEALGIAISRLPELSELKQGQGDKIEIRPIAIEDLLGRPQAVLDRPGMRGLVNGRRVMVTGAGGSIGSELVRQLAGLGPAEMVLLEASEYALYMIDGEVRERFPNVPCHPVLADVRDQRRVDDVFSRHKPELVFHAAALKHVPLVEMNPVEGFLTNVRGTRVVADAAARHGTGLMVLISTDKAVNPTSVMGATKRTAERYCQSLDARGGATQYVTVRFGNVLGSTGSVVPLFRRQLEKGGPLTVTHPDMTRYFMTIREAVELVLQASTLGYGRQEFRGRILVLDMGKPIKIVDLARQMIRLAGLRPDKDVNIVFTGLRPGEKLYEEVFHGAEQPLPTEQAGILLAQVREDSQGDVAATVRSLEGAALAGDLTAVLNGLHTLVPEFTGLSAETAAAPANNVATIPLPAPAPQAAGGSR